MYNMVHVCGLLVCCLQDSHDTFDMLATKVILLMEKIQLAS